MERLLNLVLLITCVLCDRLELPAYEYLKRFDKPLILGQCANRIVQYKTGSYAEPCMFPNRTGEWVTKFKEIYSRKLIPIHDASHLMQYLGMCDAESAEYFGLLAKGDCVATEIAAKMSFKSKSVTWLYLEHFRPRLFLLKPGDLLDDIPGEFTHYFNNTYYTENISIGTNEVIIVEMQFRKVEEAKRAYLDKKTNMRISEKLLGIVRDVGTPRKVKVIRLSTSDKLFETKTFKTEFAVFEALEYVKQNEKQMSRIHQEIRQGLRSSHLKYIFKAYEIAPIALPQSTVPDSEKRMYWRDVALLQVDAKRTYGTNKRYRKLCRTNISNKKYKKYCLLMKQTLKELRLAITTIHTQRRDWSKISHEQHKLFITKGKQKVKLLKTRTKMLSKELKKLMKSKS